MLQLSDAGVRFGQRWIFRNLTLKIDDLTCIALLGPNGRGKTTLLRAIAGLQTLFEGKRSGPSKIGYVPQLTGTPLPFSAIEMVVMGRSRALGVFGSPRKQDYQIAHEALSEVGLSGLAYHAFDKLSGGERQLVLVARALASEATTIILDEPASALDLANQSRLLGIIRDLKERSRFTLIFSTHLPQHALQVADETVLMLPHGQTAQGSSAAILTETNMTELYGIPVRRVPMPDQVDAVVPIFR